MRGDLTGSNLIRRSLLALSLTVVALAAGPTLAVGGAATVANTAATAPATAPAATTTTTSVAATPPSQRASSSTSPAAIALAILAGLLALAAAAWGIARRQAYEPRWWASLRHEIAEAGYRASATWAEFTDWVRLGR